MKYFIFLLSIAPCLGSKVICQYYDSNPPNGASVNHTPSNETIPTQIQCGKESKYCYALFNRSDNGNVQFLKQGCWEASPPSNPTPSSLPPSSSYCQRPNCTAYSSPSNSTHPLHFCCCHGSNCNGNISLIEITAEEEEEELEELFEEEKHNYVFVVVGVSVIGLIAGGIVLSRLCFVRQKTPVSVVEEEEEALCDFKVKSYDDAFDLKLDMGIVGEPIASGRFATIHKTTSTISPFFSNKQIALKIYSHAHRDFFDNERSIYETLGKDDNILKYFGWTESPSRLILAFELMDCNLRDFLKTETFGVKDCIDIVEGVAGGVAYLHCMNDLSGTAVAHRDLSSRNILINKLSRKIRIADFGLSLLTKGAKYYWGGKERQAEFCSIAEAGTMRYMAPELLEGAVNLKDCENALKQADVYSLALILWEVANSCGDLRLEGEEGALHELPYSEEGGKDLLLLEDVVQLVVQCRLRPSFHKWHATPLTRSLRDTLTESWDSEPDARLTSLCIVERVQELKQNLSSNKFMQKSGKALEIKKVVENEDIGWISRNTLKERNVFGGESGGTVSTVLSVSEDVGGGVTGGVVEDKVCNVRVSQPRSAISMIQNNVGGGSRRGVV